MAEILDLNSWPDHSWTPSTRATEGQEDSTVIRIPFVLTPIYMEKKMGQKDREEYKQMTAQLTEQLPESVDTVLLHLATKAFECLNSFARPLDDDEPLSVYLPLLLREFYDACNYFCLHTELRRRLFKFNRLIDRDIRDYLALALDDPRSPMLSKLASAVRNKCNALTLFKNKIIRYIQEEENHDRRDDSETDSDDDLVEREHFG